MEVSPTSSAATQATSQKAGGGLASDFKSFLTLLTTQLKHQDPLEPVDSTEFTSQLAQFAAVEQGIATNSNLEKLISAYAANQNVAAVSYLGKEVVAKGDTATLANGKASFAYELSENAESTAIGIRNAAGIPVLVTAGELKAGRHNFVWDGKTSQGVDLPEGKYEIVVTAADADGKQISTQTYVVGIVDGADSTGDGVSLSINGVSVPLAEVVTVREAPLNQI